MNKLSVFLIISVSLALGIEPKKKPAASYLVRDEIEKVRMEKGIPPERFGEFAKSGWKDIITKFC